MEEYRRSGLILFFSVLSLATYATAFVVPNHFSGDGTVPQPFWGTMIFVWGLILCWVLPLTFAWWANVLFWIALFFPARAGRAWASGAGLLALSLWIADPSSELICLPYYLWMSSMFFYAFACHLIVREENAHVRTPQGEQSTEFPNAAHWPQPKGRGICPFSPGGRRWPEAG